MCPPATASREFQHHFITIENARDAGEENRGTNCKLAASYHDAEFLLHPAEGCLVVL